jgi:hypothetical protein
MTAQHISQFESASNIIKSLLLHNILCSPAKREYQFGLLFVLCQVRSSRRLDRV